MELGTVIALGALVLSVFYNWQNRRDAESASKVLIATFTATLDEWRRMAEKRIDQLEEEFKLSQPGVVNTRLNQVEKFMQEIRDWKHEVVDPYIPRGMTDHERRIGELERDR